MRVVLVVLVVLVEARLMVGPTAAKTAAGAAPEEIDVACESCSA